MSRERLSVTTCRCGEVVIVGVGCGSCRYQERQRLRKILEELKEEKSVKVIVDILNYRSASR